MTKAPHVGPEKQNCPNLHFDHKFPDGACCCLTKDQEKEHERRLSMRGGESAWGGSTQAP